MGGGGVRANTMETGKYETSRFSRRVFLMTLIDFKTSGEANEGSKARITLELTFYFDQLLTLF